MSMALLAIGLFLGTIFFIIFATGYLIVEWLVKRYINKNYVLKNVRNTYKIQRFSL